MQTDILIVGGGLAGLNLARLCESSGRDWCLLEARERLGGRVLSEGVEHASGVKRFDMGPAWFWPGQPRIAELINQYALKAFFQHAEGELLFEDERGQVQRGRGFASMQGSYRLAGGLQTLIEALANDLPSGSMHMRSLVKSIKRHDGRVLVKAQRADGSILEIMADRVMLAIPPRVAAERINYHGDVPEQSLAAMRDIPTWMAGHAKAMAVYNEPFWRNEGLSGDVMSRHGPMVEIHDASPPDGGLYALFGFLGVPPENRIGQMEGVRQAIMTQLVRVFGEKAISPVQLFYKDWVTDPLTATDLDQIPLRAHPHYGLPECLRGVWDGQLLFSSTEVAPTFGGYLEGALEAAEQAFSMLG